MTTATTLPSFLTHGGATVTMTSDRDGYSWTCHGCDDAERPYRNREDAVDDANQHADTCRSMPKPGEPQR